MIDWNDIVEQHGPDVWRTAYRLVSNRDDANDCYQDTFLQAAAAAQRRPVANWSALLRRIVTSRGLDCLRRRYRQAERFPRDDDGDPAESRPAPDAIAEQRESIDVLQQELARLSPRLAEAFWLSEVELLSHAEIAEQLAATSSQVATWLSRAKQKLRERLTFRGVTNEASP